MLQLSFLFHLDHQGERGHHRKGVQRIRRHQVHQDVMFEIYMAKNHPDHQDVLHRQGHQDDQDHQDEKGRLVVDAQQIRDGPLQDVDQP